MSTRSGAWLVRNRLLVLGLLVTTGLLAQVVKRTPQSDVIQQLGLVVPMRDGIRLAADLYLP